MSKNNLPKSPIALAKVGNYTKNAVENFEEGIVNQHNFLEKVDQNLRSKKNIE